MNKKRSKLGLCCMYLRVNKNTVAPLRFRMFVVVVAVIILIFFLWTDMVKPSGYPPGPLWFPIVGSYPQFRCRLADLGYHHLVWAELAQQYGPVTGLRLGFDRIIVVSGYDAVRDVLLRDEFDGRPDGFFFRHRTFGQRLGVVFTDGPLWMETRKFTLQGLGRLGKRNILAAHLETEAAKLVSALQKQCDSGPVYMHTAFDVSVLNTLWAFLAGQQFELNDARLMELLDIVHTSFRMIDMSGGLLNQMPFLRFLAPKLSGYSDLVSILERLWAFLRVTIVEHRKSFNPANNRDLIDLFLQKMENKKDSKNLAYSELQLLSLCLDLFMAGSETTSNTLGFAVVYMLRHPEVQLRIQNEMDEVIGRDRQPTMEDRPKLNYVEAVLMEVQRVASIAPVAVAHRAVKDTILMGHSVPKGTTLLISIWSLHMDPKHWKDPEIFRPERFLDSQGRLIQDDWFIPFGFGKRRCLGEMLARHSLFMFFSTLLHNFSVSVPPGYSMPSLEGYDGVTLSPKPFPAKLTPRRTK